MSTWALIPVKHLSTAKSSLGKALTPPQRRELVLNMLADVLNAVHKAPSVEGSIVVSPDEEVLKFARTRGALGLADYGARLNEALELAIKHAMAKGATSILILPSDIPLLTAADVENIISITSSPRAAVIAPSKDNGTNALFLRPPDIMDLRFGGESFPIHLAEARRVGVRPHIYRSVNVATDVDDVEDLFKVETNGLGTGTQIFLRSLRAQTKSGTNL
jgi:2-phospho-L-lactate guanylyltransferase